jgi:shikimate dehydrogenase
LNEATRLDGRRALVIGAGGAARAVVYGLKREGALVTLSNRSTERGEALAGTFQCDFIPLADLSRSAGKQFFNIVVQCTPVGLMGKEAVSIVPESFFQPGQVVMDTVYRPLWTPFLLAARKIGCTVVNGLEMLLYQGVAQLEWWLGKQIPEKEGVQVMKGALMKAIADE